MRTPPALLSTIRAVSYTHLELFTKRYKLLLENTKHYIYLSSYRVYADEQHPITESAPRLLDVSDDKEMLETDTYALAKARQEDILSASSFKNWTAIRPAITFSKRRYQLVTMEANTVVCLLYTSTFD